MEKITSSEISRAAGRIFIYLFGIIIFLIIKLYYTFEAEYILVLLSSIIGLIITFRINFIFNQAIDRGDGYKIKSIDKSLTQIALMSILGPFGLYILFVKGLYGLYDLLNEFDWKLLLFRSLIIFIGVKFLLSIERLQTGFNIIKSHDFIFIKQEASHLYELDRKFIITLYNSEWYKMNQNKIIMEAELDILTALDFYAISVTPIIEMLIVENHREFAKSSISKNDLIRLHAIGTLEGMPTPVIKNEESIVSVGTQILLNYFAVSKVASTKNNKSLLRWGVGFNLIQNSVSRFGRITETEINDYIKKVDTSLTKT